MDTDMNMGMDTNMGTGTITVHTHMIRERISPPLQELERSETHARLPRWRCRSWDDARPPKGQCQATPG